MGLDFIRNAAKSFHKGLDKSRVDLGTPDLFAHEPHCEPRSYTATIQTGRELTSAEDLGVRFHNGKIVAQRGMDIVAEFDSPPPELINALQDSHGEAYGKVREVHEIAATAEISVC